MSAKVNALLALYKVRNKSAIRRTALTNYDKSKRSSK